MVDVYIAMVVHWMFQGRCVHSTSIIYVYCDIAYLVQLCTTWRQIRILHISVTACNALQLFVCIDG